MTAPNFGMQFSRPANEIIPVLGADFSGVLCIESSADASNTEFPVDTPKIISSSDSTAVAALGTGLLADQVKGIQAQLTGINAGTKVVVVRVTEGGTAAITAASIATILNGVADIPDAINFTPRIILAGRSAYQSAPNAVGPVVTALQTACAKLLAVAPVDIDATTLSASNSARATMSSERLMPIGVAARVYEGTNLVTRSMAARVAGLFVRVDNENFGKPFDPIANRAVYGLADLSRKIPFSLTDASTEGQTLLGNNISIVARGQTGVDGAAADGGFVFIGTDGTGGSTLWQQIHQVRGADYLTVKMMQITRYFLGQKVTADLVEAWLNSIAFMLRDEKAAGNILGYSPVSEMFKASQNSPENIRLGTLKIDVGLETAPVFKLANSEVRRWRPAVEGLVEEIVARLNNAA